ncbi:MAG: cation-transporting P-type ATPase [Chloroflexi bacterium]|nr:cation-transporting P-type ATPase [Chloroflexota bacterium]
MPADAAQRPPPEAPPPGESGLSATEARALLRSHGPNRLLPEARRLPALLRFVRPLVDSMAILLLLAAPIYIALGNYLDAVVTLTAIIPIAGVNYLLEARSERALAELRQLTAPLATAWRDGRAASIPAVEIVPGDLLLVREGDVIPADGTLVGVARLMVDESSLTGESHPVAKANSGAGDDDDALYAGTNVLSGRGFFRVGATGPATRFGQVGTLVATIEQKATPLQALINRLVRQFAAIGGVVCVVVVGTQLAYGEGTGAALIAGVSLAIAAIPEEFPMVFTLYLGLGAWRLAKENALVRRLVGVETLGATTVICTDKTGTLTLGHLEVAALAAGTEVTRGGEAPGAAAKALLESAMLASEPQPFDPLEVAIVRYAGTAGLALPGGLVSVAEHPFDPAAKYLSRVWQRDGRHEVFAKGALEGILAVAALSEPDRRTAEETNAALASEGMRVIAVAAGELPGGPQGRTEDERHLRFLGLVAFSDPVRPGVLDALEECRAAGIRVVMITGDHPITAMAVANSLHLPAAEDDIITGAELDALSHGGRAERIANATVFARTQPAQKYEIVRALRAAGETVAMTGDGINDAPALREADIGIAMGRRGTQVAREAATLVLIDDDFSTIVGAIRDGRRIFENLRRAVAYLVGFHVPLLLVAMAVPLTGEPLLLLPVHLVILELILHPTVALVFEGDPPPPGLMQRPPRSPSEPLVSRRHAARPLATGFTLAAATVALYLARLAADVPEEHARGMAFTAMVLGQTIMVLVERSPDAPVWRAKYRGSKTLLPVVAATLALLVAIVYLPGLNDAMRLEGPSPAELGVALLVAAATTLWLEPWKGRKPTPAAA